LRTPSDEDKGHSLAETDKVDARILAHLLRSELVAERYVPHQRADQAQALPCFVRMRTMVKNQVKPTLSWTSTGTAAHIRTSSEDLEWSGCAP